MVLVVSDSCTDRGIKLYEVNMLPIHPLAHAHLTHMELCRPSFEIYKGPDAYGLLMSEWGDLEGSNSKSIRLPFQLIGSRLSYAVHFPLVIMGSRRLFEDGGKWRQLRATFAGRFTGEPRDRPTKEEADVIVPQYNVETHQGSVLVTDWLEQWVYKQHREIEEHQRYLPDY